MTERMVVQTDGERSPSNVPLVLHVIPTALARGAQREARALADELDSPGVRCHRLLSLFDGPSEVATDFSLDYPGGDAPAIGFDFRLVRRLRAELARLAPAVVVAHGSEPLKYLVPAGFGHGRPIAYYAIGTYSGSRRRLQLWMWRYLVRRADVVAAEGQEVLDECVSRLGVPAHRAMLAPNGRDPESFHPRVSEDDSSPPLVMFVGALTNGKRPDRFVEVVAELRARGIALRAELIGDGPLRTTVSGPAQVANIALFGSRSDVAQQLRRADVFVFPSRPAGEGMPGVLIEAGLSGVPVVATAVPGVNELMKEGETGFVVGVDDLPAMVTATARLLDDPELRASMGRAARQHCLDNFTLVKVAARWVEILQPLVDANGRRCHGR
jgi:glycosyltransferase involved in cell wall biosynthesis